MLAVFHKSLAEPSVKLMGAVVFENPPTEQSEETMKELSRLFKDEHHDPMAIHLLPYCILNTALDHQSVVTPSVLTVKDDVVCLFRGTFENRAEIATLYNLPTPKNDSAVVIWAYNKFCNQEDETEWLDAVKGFKGGFSFVMYDAKKKTLFVTSGLDGIPCFWGLGPQGTILFSSCLEIASTKCESFYGQLPKGCYYASGKGLRSFESPDVVLKAQFVPPDNQ
ncbi:hypothetical protein Bca4012_041220 [Brassica carinata]|uniref:DUF3700 domain-containing protein n=1 Tax=Brassica carinata TaxID=52824 RepID=A0A8X7UG44_BRACI|nr:hypothetical protein Bca52824_061015 [Brassica carinata]